MALLADATYIAIPIHDGTKLLSLVAKCNLSFSVFENHLPMGEEQTLDHKL